MEKFLSLVKLHFKTALVYRFSFMASIIITPIFLLMNYFIWSAVYKSQPVYYGYTFADMMTYYVIVMLIGHFVYNQVGNSLQQDIVYGDMNQYLLKPVQLLWQYLAIDVAERSLAFLVEVLPLFFISLLFFNVKTVWYLYILFVIGMIFAFLINFLITFLFGLMSFWIEKTESLQWLLFWFIMFLSGQMIPLEFFGPALFNISKFLPFYYIRYGVAQIFLGKLSFFGIAEFFLIQTAWVAFFYIAIRFTLRLALKKYGAVGG